MAVKFERRTAADGYIVIPAKVVKNIQVFCFWAREHVCLGQQLIAADFTPQALLEAEESMQLRGTNKKHPQSNQTDSIQQIGLNRILSKVQKSFWSSTHVNSFQKYALYVNLHILLNI